MLQIGQGEDGQEKRVRIMYPYNQDTADKICNLFSTTNKSHRVICDEVGIPRGTMFRWLKDSEFFREQYAQAKAAQAHLFADEVIEIADEDISYGDLAAIQRNKLRVESRKWAASKLLPKVYGNNSELNVDVTVKKTLSNGEFKDVLAAVVNKKIENDKNSSIEEAHEIDEDDLEEYEKENPINFE